MTAKTKFKTEAFAAIHASAGELHKINAINKIAMLDFDVACLVALAEFEPPQIVGKANASS